MISNLDATGYPIDEQIFEAMNTYFGTLPVSQPCVLNLDIQDVFEWIYFLRV